MKQRFVQVTRACGHIEDVEIRSAFQTTPESRAFDAAEDCFSCSCEKARAAAARRNALGVAV